MQPDRMLAAKDWSFFTRYLYAFFNLLSLRQIFDALADSLCDCSSSLQCGELGRCLHVSIKAEGLFQRLSQNSWAVHVVCLFSQQKQIRVSQILEGRALHLNNPESSISRSDARCFFEVADFFFVPTEIIENNLTGLRA